MKRFISIVLILVTGVGLAWFSWTSSPKPTSAGGLPCYQCHGVQFEGSDLAPRLAGTNLTDAEILNQIKNPRGIMPAFPEFADTFVVQMIRAAPTGLPTKEFSAQERSFVLAMLSGVAKERATRFYHEAFPRTETPRPSATASARQSATPTRPSVALTTQTSPPTAEATNWNSLTLPLGILAVSGIAMIGTLLVSRRRARVR